MSSDVAPNTQVLSWPDRIHAALEETANAFRALAAARARAAPASERAKLDRLSQEAATYSNALKAECRDAFAKSRGWRFNKKAWAYDLARDASASNGAWFIDHAEFFDSPDQKRFALVTHSYASKEELARYAAQRGYHAELLPFSWHNPYFNGGCRAVVFILKAGAKWP